MTLPTTGKISLGDTNVELKLARATAIRMSNPLVRALAVKASGKVAMSDLRGKTYSAPADAVAFQVPGTVYTDQYGEQIGAAPTPKTFNGYSIISFTLVYSTTQGYSMQLIFSPTSNSAPMNAIKGITMGGVKSTSLTVVAGTTKITVGNIRAAITQAQFNAIKAAIANQTTTCYLHI